MREISPQMSAVEKCIASERDINQYMDKLNFTNKELDKWKVIVDLGSGTEQEFAKGIKNKGLNNIVISIDARLALPKEIDLKSFFPEEVPARLRGRENSEEGTIAALAQDLPLKKSSIDVFLALHSIPQYIKDSGEVNRVLLNMLGCLKEGGEIRIYPIHKTINLAPIQKFLDENENILNYKFILKEKIEGEEKYLLIIKKTKEKE
jgi:SAM-dependent methyltransferase